MEYNLNALPYLWLLPKLELGEAKQAFDRFLDQKAYRIQQLTMLIDADNEEEVRLDNNPESLPQLEKWLRRHAESMPLTDSEWEQKVSQLPERFRADASSFLKPWKLTNRTLSIAYDAGTCLGEMMIQNHPGRHWEFWLKNDIDKHQPVVVPFGSNRAMNAIVLPVNMVSRYTENPDVKLGLQVSYETWVGYLTGETQRKIADLAGVPSYKRRSRR